MASPTNLTEQISKLREREGGFLPDQQTKAPFPTPQSGIAATPRERKFATDYFMLFAYGLFGAAIIAQLLLIIWLDIL